MQAVVSSTAQRVAGFAKTPRARKILWWIVGLVVAFALIGFLVVPPIAKWKLEEELSKALHRQVTVESVRVNPFAPSATVRGFAVRERSGDGLFVTFDELYVNAAWTSIFRLAPVIDAVRLTKPHLRVVRNNDRTYNFQDLVDEVIARPKSAGPTPKFAVFNIQLVDGRIDVDDRAEDEKHEIADLRVGIPFVSSLPSHVEVTVVPELGARINGSPLGVKGETRPFHETRHTALNVDLDDFDLTRLVDYLPFKLRGKVKSALLDTRLVVAFEQPDGRSPQVKVHGATAVKRVNVLDLEDRPMIAWQRLGMEINEVNALAPAVDLKSVELEVPEVHVRRDKSRSINLERVADVAAAGAERQREARKETGAVALPIKVGLLALRSGKARFTDETTTPAFETAIDELQFEAKDFDNAKGKRNEVAVQARTDAGEMVKLAAGVVADPPGADGRVEIAGLALKRYQPYVRQAADLEIDDGQLDLGVAFKWASDLALEKHDLKVTDLTLELKSLRARLPNEKEPLVRIASIEVKGAGADLLAQTAYLGEIAVREAAATLRREKDGRLNVERITRAGKAGAPENPERTPTAATQASPSWRIDLGQLSVERASVAFEDLAVGEPLKVNIAPIQLKAEKLSTAKGQRGNISLRATIDKTGSLAASGPLALDPLSGSLRIDARTIGITPAQRYIDDQVNLAITSGALSARGNASFAMPPGGTVKASYKGDFSLTDFASVDKPTSTDLLNWKSLSLGAIDFNLEPLNVAVDEIALADFYARIILSAEGRLNLQDLRKSPGDASAAKPEPPPAEKPASPAPKPAAEASRPSPAAPMAALPANIRIGRVTLQGGNVNFSDFFIKPNYSANLTGVGGAVTEITPEKAGDVELRAKIDNAAPVEILGRVNPLATDLFLDIKASARDIELPPMSPYSVKYAGYGIERGKLSVNVKYHIENRKLAAENNIYLDQLTFGEKVDSPTATKLPVTLAVALLKDRNGVIDVNLPISGSLDDPKFSVIGIVFQVIGNLIVKAVTAPFALLGAAFGGGEELAYLEFAPGSAALDGEDVGKLKNLTKALTERPGLKLDVAGRIDPVADREGLKHASIERKVKVEKFNDLRREGKAPPSADAVTVEKAEYEKYLRRAYGDEKFPKPRNIIGLAKVLPVPEMETLMLTHAQVTEEDLRMLANARAQSAKDWLVTEGKVPADRVFIVASKLTANGVKDKGKPTRADFSLK
ncbi:MAG TPA: DUF748 domain-containing protein [Burkholderiales bacterium]|nr:DUF748 domain-containing protein [Burkholderiales bacterium]